MQETIPYQPGMKLGRTYDLQKLQPGLDIFTDEALSRSKTIERHQTSIRYSVINKSSDINNILDVGSEISLKVKVGIFKVAGMGSYLKEDRWKENTLEIVARAHVETMTETMIDSNPKPDWKKNIVGSHYIRSITYGGDLIVRIQIQGSDNRQIEDIKAKLDAGLTTGGIFDARAKGNFRKMGDDLKACSNININYYSTSLQGHVPRDIEGMLNALDTFNDQVIKLNEGKGAPLMCELQPLNTLDPDLPQIMRDTSLDVQLGSLEENYDDIVQAKARFDHWAKNEALELTGDQEKKASELEKRLENMISVFNRVIASMDVTIGGKGKLKIEEAISAYKNNKKLGGFKREVARFLRSVQPLSEATPLTPLRDLPLGEQLDLDLVGKTGHGKSATGNTILGDSRFPSESSATSVTTQCHMEHGTVEGRDICLVDTPGMLDTDHPDEIFQEVPRSTAEWLKELARYASWHTANHVKGYRMDAQRDEACVREYYKKLCGNGVFSIEFITIYQAMAWSAAWSTANERFDKRENAAMDKKQWIENHEKLMKCCEVTPEVANDLRDLCWFSGWFTANTRRGFPYNKDAAEDERKIKMYFERICL